LELTAHDLTWVRVERPEPFNPHVRCDEQRSRNQECGNLEIKQLRHLAQHNSS